MYSTVMDWQYDVDAMRKLIDPIQQFKTQNPYHLKEHRNDMDQWIYLLKDFAPELQQQILNSTPLPLDLNEHSVAIETVKQGSKVPLHKDWGMSWTNPLTRKTNVMFNLEDCGIEIIHDKPEHNKWLNPGQLMILDVTKQHGANTTSLNKDFVLYTVNLRRTYSDTVELLNSL